MRRYPGNFTDSELLSIPRTFKARPWAPEVNLAYVTKDEEKLLQKLKPDTPHEGPEKVPSYDTFGTIVGGRDVGGSTAGGGGGWSGDRGGGQDRPQFSGNVQQTSNYYQSQIDEKNRIKAEKKRIADQKARAIEGQKRVDAARKLRPPQKTQAQKQADMAKAMALAYKQQQIGGTWIEEGGKMVKNPNVRYERVSNLHNLTDSELQFLIDSGFAAAEASGTLGGVAGIEAEVNKAKKRFAETGDRTHLERLGYSEEILNRMDPYAKDASGQWIKNPNYDPTLAYDPSGMRTWGDVESDPYLYKAHSDLLSSGLTTDKYKGYMKNISSFGHPFPTVGGGGGGGGGGSFWGSGGGGGYGGGGGGGYGPPEQFTPRGNPNELWGQQNPLQQAMISIHGGKGFKQGFRRGGIVSLVT
jgi:hypothetical protein